MPDQIRDAIYWDGYKGYTTTDRLTKFVRETWDWQAEELQQSAWQAEQTIRSELVKGNYVVTRSYEPEGYYHFTPATGYGTQYIVRHNVLGGKREVLSLAAFYARYAGWTMIFRP